MVVAGWTTVWPTVTVSLGLVTVTVTVVSLGLSALGRQGQHRVSSVVAALGLWKRALAKGRTATIANGSLLNIVNEYHYEVGENR
jgi:hypothetical protein